MPRYKVAHIREQGVDLIIVLLESSFDLRSNQEQILFTAQLQRCARSAGLAGTVVPVWEVTGGRMKFLAPTQWHAFFSGIDLLFVETNINRELICQF